MGADCWGMFLPMTPKALKSDAKKVRVSDGKYERMEGMADAGRKEGVTITGIVDQALQLLFDKLDHGDLDPALTPLSAEERELVRAVLTMARTPSGKLEPMLLDMVRESYETHHKVR